MAVRQRQRLQAAAEVEAVMQSSMALLRDTLDRRRGDLRLHDQAEREAIDGFRRTLHGELRRELAALLG